jgi:hypothetical protein
LAFDGYHSKVTLPATKAPSIGRGLTIDAWVAPAAYPFEWGPIVDQCEWGKKGYYFGVDQRGQLGLMAQIGSQWEQLIAPDRIPLKTWTHVAGTFDPASGALCLYLNGELKATRQAAKQPIVPSGTDLLIGLNSIPLEASGLPTLIGFEGLIDEVNLYDAPLQAGRISTLYAAMKPDAALRDRPDLQDRILPGRSGKTGMFGASYARLPYYDLWDAMWFTNDYPDIAVTFDELPTSVVFWRGTNYGPGMVTENNRWMIDQSIETGYEGYGCCEHMSDKQCRFSHVRLIENTDARVVVHWRYAYVAASLEFPWKFPPTNEEWPRYQSWGDEYYTIYPDGVVVRSVHNNANASVYWQDIQFLSPPGQTPEDQVDLRALTVGGIRFWSKVSIDTLNLDWTNGTPKNTLSNANMELIHFKSDYKVYLIFPIGTFVSPWGGKGKYSHFMTWNHWPEAQIRSDGRSALFTDRLTHSALAAADNAVFQGNRVLYGFTNRGISSLLPLSLSWNYPPPIRNAQGCRSLDYDPDQRAYVLDAKGSPVSFDVVGSRIRPIVNPCFVVKHWGSRTQQASLTVDGQPLPTGPDFRQGVIIDTDGTPTLVVWIKKTSESRVHFTLNDRPSSIERSAP